MPAYTETLLVFDGFAIDLRKPVPAEARDSLMPLGLDGQFGIVTPFNPRGIDQPREVNSDRMRKFEEDLRQAKYEYVRVDGCSPDRSHCECSVAIMAPIDDRGLPRARAADGRRLTRKESRKLALSRRALADLEAWTQDLPSVLRPSLPSDHRQPQPVGR